MAPSARARAATAALAAASLAATATAAPAQPFDLQLTPPDIVAARGAACLDGSPPGVYLMRGAATTKWRIHFHGGGFCFNLTDCRTRAQGIYGSSLAWPQSVYDLCDSPSQCTAVFGLLSNYSTNPMGDWNAVLVPYCDGSSYTSAASGTVGGLHFRGRAIFDAVIDQLERLGGLTSSATDVIFTGTSAGGVVMFEHADEFRARMPPGATVVAMPDAGVFLDAPTAEGVPWYGPTMAGVAPLWNATLGGGTDPACLAAYGPSSPDAWKCLLAQYLAPFRARPGGVPFYVVNSQYDAVSMMAILQVGCSLAVPGQCSPAQAAAIANYRGWLAGNVTAFIDSTADGGYFLHSCWQHESTCRWADWDGIAIGGVTMMQSFTAWYDGVRAAQGKPPLFGGTAVPTRLADGPYGSDTTCQPQGFVHGGC